MAWLRIDDRFVSHPKIRCLSDRHFRVWMRLLCTCAQHSDGTVDDGLIDEVSDLGNATLRRFVDLGLLDEVSENPHVYAIHNWSTYQPKDPTAAERMRNYRRNADRNANRDSRAGTRAFPSRPVLEDDLSFHPSALQDADGRTENAQAQQNEPTPVAGEAQALLAQLQRGAPT
jgi:hypothetical protein